MLYVCVCVRTRVRVCVCILNGINTTATVVNGSLFKLGATYVLSTILSALYIYI